MIAAGFAGLPLSMPSSSYFSFPYIIALLVILVAAAILLLISSPFRNYRRKRNIVIYAVFTFIVILLVFQIDNVSRRGIIDFGFNTTTNKAFPDEVNQIILYSQNHGDRSASFYLDLSSANATFQVQSQKDYVLVNSNSIKVPFSISESWFSASAQNQPVYYTIEGNVSSFSFSAAIENRGMGGLGVSSGFSSLTFVWNSTQKCYVMMYGGGFTV